MEETKQLLEELLAVQIIDIAMRMEARHARGEEAVPETFLKEAISLVRKNRERIIEDLRSDGEDPKEAERSDAPGQSGNLEKASKMSLKQKRYDLQRGLF